MKSKNHDSLSSNFNSPLHRLLMSSTQLDADLLIEASPSGV